jgi:hypothetical protein
MARTGKGLIMRQKATKYALENPGHNILFLCVNNDYREFVMHEMKKLAGDSASLDKEKKELTYNNGTTMIFSIDK